MKLGVLWSKTEFEWPLKNTEINVKVCESHFLKSKIVGDVTVKTNSFFDIAVVPVRDPIVSFFYDSFIPKVIALL